MGQIKNIKLHIVTDIKFLRSKQQQVIRMAPQEEQEQPPRPRPQNDFGIHQYNVRFEPEIESDEVKSTLLHGLDDVLGNTRCFDGTWLFLPKKLVGTVTERMVTLPQGDIKVVVTHTRMVPQNSPHIVPLINIMFRRELNAVGMQIAGAPLGAA